MLLGHADASGSLLRLNRRSIVRMLVITAFAAPDLLIVHPPLPVVLALEIRVMAIVCIRAMGRPGGRQVALGIAALIGANL